MTKSAIKKFKPAPPAVKKAKRTCALTSIVVETAVRIHYDSLRSVLELPARPDDPVMISIEQAVQISRLSRTTIERMIRRGRPAPAPEPQSAAA